MGYELGSNESKLAYWRARRRRRLLFMVGRYALVLAIVVVVAWVTGGYWLRGLALIASALLIVRLAVFFYTDRHLEDRLDRARSGRPFRR